MSDTTPTPDAPQPVGYLSQSGHYLTAALWTPGDGLVGYNIPLYAAPTGAAARIAALQAERDEARAEVERLQEIARAVSQGWRDSDFDLQSWAREADAALSGRS